MPEILCGGHDLQREAKPPVYQRFADKTRWLTEPKDETFGTPCSVERVAAALPAVKE